ncbi:hypothetical protein [Streptomyces microflavus]|uniref:hypothetical protein n=1 Tax=Streptomyces microflavus TaxID=1919 RepID=UPI00381F97AE
MLAFQVHDVRIIRETREVAPQDGWKRFEPTGNARLKCSCGHEGGPMWARLAPLMAQLHIHAQA